VVTIFTTIVWISITFITINQSQEVRLKMMPILESRKIFIKRFIIALLIGVLVMVFLAFSWNWILS
jgi:hypothetical protein